MADTPVWQTAYEAAVLEVDNSKIIQKVNDAEAAIFRRLQTLDRIPMRGEERGSLKSAINILRALRSREQAALAGGK
jgi:hypothetical protein